MPVLNLSRSSSRTPNVVSTHAKQFSMLYLLFQISRTSPIIRHLLAKRTLHRNASISRNTLMSSLLGRNENLAFLTKISQRQLCFSKLHRPTSLKYQQSITLDRKPCRTQPQASKVIVTSLDTLCKVLAVASVEREQNRPRQR